MTNLKRKVERSAGCEVLFVDLFDTLVHRTVHPNYALRLWAKFVVRELGLQISGSELFAIRNDSLSYLGIKNRLSSVEVAYVDLIQEVYLRLTNTDALSGTSFEKFTSIFQTADYLSEISVQFKNENLIATITALKKSGYRIYLLTDYYLSKEVVLKILDFHQIGAIFDKVFVSCSLQKSKEKGTIYAEVLSLTKSKPESTLMIGDNKKSDIENAAKLGIDTYHLKHLSHKIRNKQNLLGDDTNDFRKVCRKTEVVCLKSDYLFSEYVLHFYFFTERLYINARRHKIKNLFFLAREGFYLKRLFDCYQEMNLIQNESRIGTHYLKASRQSATQIALRPLPQEDFGNFRGKFGKMSLRHFLDWFPFPDNLKEQITEELDYESNETYSNFFKSKTIVRLKGNRTFQEAYERNRQDQKKAFMDYLLSFGPNIEEEGLNLVDVGWGGTMQESIYNFLDKKIPVTGYYLGLKEVYNIQKKTKRYGLNFSVYPSKSFSDDVLKANGQLYEQLLAAPHGSTLSYRSNENSSPTVEFHEKNEKQVFDTCIEPIQEFMFLQFKNLFNELRSIDYSQDMAQDYLTDMALRMGILSSKEKIKFINQISKGFYQNVGENKVGLSYNPKQLRISKFSLFKKFLKSPEKVFRYLVKVKPFMFSKGMYWLSWPVNLTYYYIKFNFWFKKKWMNKGLIS